MREIAVGGNAIRLCDFQLLKRVLAMMLFWIANAPLSMFEMRDEELQRPLSLLSSMQTSRSKLPGLVLTQSCNNFAL
jgi:hypothetical protein